MEVPKVESRLKRYLSNLFLVLGSTLVTLLFLNFFFVRALPLIPFRHHASIPEGLAALAQISKSGSTPENYIAILGDSYAQGLGDWLLGVRQQLYPRFSSAHVINSELKRDVISVGGSGAGSIKGLVTEPISQFTYLRSFLGEKFSDPSEIVVYFYEGNDLDDNLKDLELRFKMARSGATVDERREFSLFLDRLIKNDTLVKEAEDMSLLARLPLLGFIWALVNQLSEEVQGNLEVNEFEPALPGETNKVFMNNKVVSIPDMLQAPAVELTNEEMTEALRVFQGSLRKLVSFFPSTRVMIVLIPSPLSSYEIASTEVQIQSYQKRSDRVPRQLVERRHREICVSLQQIAKDFGIGFRDFREPVLEATNEAFLHGPRDWKHFNREGYTLLGRFVADVINHGSFDVGECATE